MIMAVGCTLILSAEFLGMHEGMSNYCHDLFFRLRGIEEPDRRILIVAIDDQTLGRLGRWPLKRTHFARLLDALGAARVIGLDILMPEPSPDDAGLAAAIRRQGSVVLPVSIEHPFPALGPRSAGAPFRTGHTHLEQDIDGVVRKVYHTLYRDGRAVPSFASILDEAVTGKPMPREEPSAFAGKGGRRTDILQLDQRRINFLGDPGTIPQISMVDVIEGRYPPAFFTNRIILVGLTADGLEGGVLTPFSQMRGEMSGVEVHATILNNLLDNNHIVEASEAVRAAVSLLAALAGFLLFLRVSGRNLLGWWFFGLTAALLVSFGMLVLLQHWFSPVLFIALLSFMFVFAYVVKLEQTGKRLREAEAEWEDSFNMISDGIILVDGNATVTRMNEAAGTMQAPRVLGLLATSRQSACGDGDGTPPSEEEIRDPVTENWYEVRTLSGQGLERRPGSVVHVFRDITAAKKMEEEKEALRFQFLQAQKMESIGRLAGGIAHDFNNILTAIIAYSEMAQKRTGLDARLSDYLKIINESGHKAASLIRQLLVFSRKSSMELQVVNIRAIVENMAKILRRVIGEDLNLTLQFQSAVGNVFADPGQIEQIIMNLAVNARDAMPQGGTLEIMVAEVELDESYTASHLELAPGAYVRLAVQDSGLGMTPEIQARIFEPFFTTKRADEGTGLGLSTVYGIVKQMSGHIHVYSEVGRGTVFKLYFPVCGEQPPKTKAAETETPAGGNETILIAEDDASILALVSSILQPLGYNVLAAGSGSEALKLASQADTRIDLLLTDVVMPGMGGKELSGFILEKYPEARVVFMSGYTDETLVQQGVEQQYCTYIQKPLMATALARKLREVLDEGRSDHIK